MNSTALDEPLADPDGPWGGALEPALVAPRANGSAESWAGAGHVSSLLLWGARAVAIGVGLWALRILSQLNSIADRIAYSQGVALCIYIGMCLVNEIPFLREEAWARAHCYLDASVKISTMTYLHGTESLIALSRCLDVVKAVFMRRFSKRRIFWCSFGAVSAMAVAKTAVQLLWTTPAPAICASDIKYFPSWDLVVFLVVTGASYGYMIVFVFLRCALVRVRAKLNLASVAATVGVHLLIDAGFAFTLVYLNDTHFLGSDASFTLIILFSALIPLSYVVISTLPRARVRHDLSACCRVLGSRCCRPLRPRAPPDDPALAMDVLDRRVPAGEPQAAGRGGAAGGGDEGARKARRAPPGHGGARASLFVLPAPESPRCRPTAGGLSEEDSEDCDSTGDEGDSEAPAPRTRY